VGLSGSVLIQLTVAILAATVLFYGAYSLPQKIAAIVLLVLIPFQPVDTHFFTANVLLAYVIFIAMLLRGSDVHLPMLPQILILLFCYLLSFSQVHSATYVQHAVYIFWLISAFLVFWITYDVTLRVENIRSIILVFLVMNIAVAVYCTIQIALGPGTKLVLFGIEEISMLPARKDNRLTGPFRATGLTAEYFVIMIYVILYELLSTENFRYRFSLILLIGINLVLLLTTANRGGFLTLLGAGILFVWLFKKELGLRRIIGLFTGGAVALILASVIAVNYTEFGGMWERMRTTEIEAGIPDTRKLVWPVAWKEIKRNPILGHGPRFRFFGADEGVHYAGHPYIPYPHNLYLFLLLTVGTIGLIAFLVLLATPLIRCWKTSIKFNQNPYIRGLAKTGVVIMLIIFADQIKISFMRLATIDYWHFLFALLGFLIAVCDRGTRPSISMSAAEGRYFSPRIRESN